MKTKKLSGMKKGGWFKLGVAITAAMLFSSCLKNNKDYTPGISSVSLFNSYTGSSSVDFYIVG